MEIYYNNLLAWLNNPYSYYYIMLMLGISTLIEIILLYIPESTERYILYSIVNIFLSFGWVSLVTYPFVALNLIKSTSNFISILVINTFLYEIAGLIWKENYSKIENSRIYQTIVLWLCILTFCI